MKNLGELNGWYANPPEEYVKCKAANHKLSEHGGTWNCYTTYTCEVCQIKWSVDSSD